MIARCARCQGTFTTDRFGVQRCPHCGSELLLSDPNVPPAGGEPPRPPPEAPAPVTPGGPRWGEPPPAGAAAPSGEGGPVWGTPPPPPEGGSGTPPEPPPPPPPPAGGYGP